jgi:glycerate kinase
MSLAVQKGFSEILVGLGGSATTEGGISLAAPFGYQFLKSNGESIPLNGAGLYELDRILPPNKLPKASFVVATDVNNPLYGPNGAAYQFGEQKGADPEMIRRLDGGLRRLAEIVKRDLGLDLADSPGAGAAGGCGFGLMAFFGAERKVGFEIARAATNLDKLIAVSDLVLTGEGRFDDTSLHGKAPFCLAQMAASAGKPIWAFCGRVDFDEVPKHLPFELIAALSTPSRPGPPLATISSEQHAERLTNLVFERANTAYSPN